MIPLLLLCLKGCFGTDKGRIVYVVFTTLVLFIVYSSSSTVGGKTILFEFNVETLSGFSKEICISLLRAILGED